MVSGSGDSESVLASVEYGKPDLADVGVMALVPDRWGPLWQVRHHILSRLAKKFYIVWCNPARPWRTLRLGAQQSKDATNHESTVASGFVNYHPETWLPSVGRPRFLGDFTMQQRLRRAKRMLLARGCCKIILYIWRPEYARALDLIDYDISCYHIDDEYTFSDFEQPIEEREKRLISQVDQVFIHSTGLMEKKGAINPRTLFVPNGVDYQACAEEQAEPSDVKPIPHPRIGYCGALKGTLDWPLLLRLAQRHRDWHFLFVGRCKWNQLEIMRPMQRLSALPNVHFLGAKSSKELTAYPQHMDVCIMAYRQDSHSTKFGYPLKLHEYLASGKPVVSSPLRSVQEFAHIIRLAQTVEEWSDALIESLGDGAMAQAQIEARRSVARKHNWDQLVALIAEALCGRLGPTYVERFLTSQKITKKEVRTKAQFLR